MGHLRHIPVICAERDHFFMRDGIANHIMRKLIYPHADGFIHQTQMAREWLREKEGVRCKDVIIPNPLWINEFPERKPIYGRVVAIGRLAEQKNYEKMIRSFALVHKQCKDATLHIYGDGPLKTKLESLIINLDLTNSVFLEGITKNIIQVYRQAAIFVMFSQGEGYPNALMEALAMGVPAISSDCPVGGPRDMIRDGENGFLVACDNEEELADRIITLLQEPELCLKFSNNAISIRESNRFDIIYNRIMDYIRSIEYGK